MPRSDAAMCSVCDGRVWYEDYDGNRPDCPRCCGQGYGAYTQQAGRAGGSSAGPSLRLSRLPTAWAIVALSRAISYRVESDLWDTRVDK